MFGMSKKEKEEDNSGKDESETVDDLAGDDSGNSDGDTKTAKSSNIVCDLVSCEAIKEGSNKIAATIENAEPNLKDILIVSDPQLLDDSPLVEIRMLFDYYEKGFKLFQERCKVAQRKAEDDSFVEKASEILSALPDVISGVADFFKRQYTLSNESASLSDDVLKVAVAQRLQANRKINSVRILNFAMISKSDILTKLSELIKEKHETAIMVMRAQPKNNKKKDNNKEGEEEEEENPLLSEWETLSKSFDDYLKSIVSVKGKSSKLVRAIIKAQIDAWDITHLLQLSIAAGGGHVVRESKLREKGRYNFLGGAAISFALVAMNGQIKSCGIFTNLSQFHYEASRARDGYASIPLKPENP
jgi:hypothetical protein